MICEICKQDTTKASNSRNYCPTCTPLFGEHIRTPIPDPIVEVREVLRNKEIIYIASCSLAQLPVHSVYKHSVQCRHPIKDEAIRLVIEKYHEVRTGACEPVDFRTGIIDHFRLAEDHKVPDIRQVAGNYYVVASCESSYRHSVNSEERNSDCPLCEINIAKSVSEIVVEIAKQEVHIPDWVREKLNNRQKDREQCKTREHHPQAEHPFKDK